MTTGTIKRLVRERGFGFIQASDGSEIFFHRSALAAGSFEALAEGQGVEFEVQRGEKGARAVNLKVAPAAD
jgi:CspA family cold shock protein